VADEAGGPACCYSIANLYIRPQLMQ